MSKRLQVLMDEDELQRIQELAHRQHMTVAEWVRQALRRASSRQSSGDVDAKLGALRKAARHELPTGDIDRMLADIERGYAAGDPG